MCEDSSVAQSLQTSTDFIKLLINEDPTKITRAGTVPNGGKYVVLINGMVDAHLSISNVEWESLTAANAVIGDQFTSMALEGTMHVREPKGFRFTNYIKESCQVLEKDLIGVVWMLKTIFVGHSDTANVLDKTFTDMITNVKPLLFYMTDLSGIFDETGSQYEIKFVGNNDGVARLPQMMRVADGITVNLGGKNKDISLANAMQMLEKKANDIYNNYFDCISRTYVNAINQSQTTKIDKAPFSKVLYLITLDAPYDNKALYTVTEAPQQVKDGVGKCDDPLILKMGDSATIEEAMREIMSRSKQVKKDTEKDGQKYTYKITSEIKSGRDVQPFINSLGKARFSGVQSKDQYDFVVVFKVSQFAMVSNDIIKDLLENNKPNGLDQQIKDKINRNLITFDYIYTGKNIDIISFDIKMQGGLSFLQIITSSDNLYPSNVNLPSRQYVHVNSDNVLGVPKTTKTPLFMGLPIKDPKLRNHPDPKSTMNFTSALSTHASLESLEASVTILGNSNLMGITGTTDKEQQNKQVLTSDDRDVFPDWGNFPALAKVNIRMPRSNDDLTLMKQGTGDYTEEFWYTDYYYVYSVKHMFNEGKFTQQLSLMALPNKSKLDQYFKQGTDKSKGVLCDEYIFGAGESPTNGSGISGKVIAGPQEYTKSQMDTMTTIMAAAAAQLTQTNPRLMDLSTIQITRAIVLQESNAGDFFRFPPKDKTGDFGLSHLSYGITQFGLATLRDTLKTDARALNYLNRLLKTSYNAEAVDSIPDKDLVVLLSDDMFALAMTMAHVELIRKRDDVKKLNNIRYEFPELIFRKYNGGADSSIENPKTDNYARNCLQHWNNLFYNKQTTAVDKITKNTVSVTPLNYNLFAQYVQSNTDELLIKDKPSTKVGEKEFDTTLIIQQRIAQLDGRSVVPGQRISPLAPNGKPKVEDMTAGHVIQSANTDEATSGNTNKQKEKAKKVEDKTNCGEVKSK